MTAPVQARTYDESLLDLITLTSRDFARTWARMLLRDRPEIERGGVPVGPGQPTRPREGTWPEFSRTDQELNAALVLDSVLDTTGELPVTYYRPHITAARLYLGDPNLWRSRAVDGSSESRRPSEEIVGAWLAQGVRFDRMIPVHLHPLPAFDADGAEATGTVTLEDEYAPPAIPLIVGGL